MRALSSNLRFRAALTLSSAVRGRAVRAMSIAKRGSPEDEAERKRLIDAFPYPFPWGQTLDVKTPRFTLKIKVPQDRPAPKQHKLAYKIDPAPPEVPEHPSVFLGPAGKVAHSLFNASVKDGSIDSVKQSLSNFATLWEAKREIQINLMNPRTSSEDKIKYVREVAASAGTTDAVADALVDMQRNKKLHKVIDVAKFFNVLVAEHCKEKSGAIISAEPLSEKQYEAISAKMRKLVKPDETLVITREVEPALVGGFIIRIGNRAQDLSVANQITRMEAHLKDFFAKNNAAADKVLAV